MCARCAPATDTPSKAERTTSAVVPRKNRLRGVLARWPCPSHTTCPGLPGQLVVRTCFVCCVRIVRALIRDINIMTYTRYGSQIRSNIVR
eukprot:1202947-Prymnesium_polylepis.1